MIKTQKLKLWRPLKVGVNQRKASTDGSHTKSIHEQQFSDFAESQVSSIAAKSPFIKSAPYTLVTVVEDTRVALHLRVS